MKLNERIAVVTGAGQGIGAGIARVLAGLGAHCIVVDLQAEKAEQVAGDIGGTALNGDISDPDFHRHLHDQVADQFGRLDILVNNAAPGRDRSLIGKLDGPDWQNHADIVLAATARLTDALTPLLQNGQDASVVNVSSTTASAIAEHQCTWPYHVSKAGLEQLTRYQACRLGPDNIRVNAVAPGLVDRDAGRKLSDDAKAAHIIRQTVPLQRAGRSADIGNLVAFLASDMANYITGQVITIDGGLGTREVFGAALSVVDTDA